MYCNDKKTLSKQKHSESCNTFPMNHPNINTDIVDGSVLVETKLWQGKRMFSTEPQHLVGVREKQSTANCGKDSVKYLELFGIEL